jgi:hypothetical protein
MKLLLEPRSGRRTPSLIEIAAMQLVSAEPEHVHVRLARTGLYLGTRLRRPLDFDRVPTMRANNMPHPSRPPPRPAQPHRRRTVDLPGPAVNRQLTGRAGRIASMRNTSLGLVP